jgi:hypothetical protein
LYPTFIRRASLALALVGVVASLFVAPGAASAKSTIFAVDSTRDLADIDLADNVCDAAPGTEGTCTLRAAVMQANATPGQQIIRLGASVYRLSLAGDGDDNGVKGDLDIKDDTIIAGTRAGKAVSTIDATGLGDRVFEVKAPLNVQNVVVKGGSRPDFIGGGFLVFGGTLRLADSVVTGNRARSGGGIYSFSQTTVELQRSVVDGNTSVEEGGGIRAAGTTNIVESTISNNRVTGPGANGLFALGGGIVSYGNLRVERSTLHANDAQSGAGLATQNGGAVVESSTISANHATVSGGAISAFSTSKLLLQNSTVALNSAPELGGIRTSGLVEFSNTIMSNNQPANCSPLFVFIGNSTLSSDTTCKFQGVNNQTNVDAKLGLPAFNGGKTLTYALLPGSPAIDRGAPTCPALDQRGVARPQNGKCDIGAFEVAPEQSSALLICQGKTARPRPCHDRPTIPTPQPVKVRSVKAGITSV